MSIDIAIVYRMELPEHDRKHTIVTMKYALDRAFDETLSHPSKLPGSRCDHIDMVSTVGQTDEVGSLLRAAINSARFLSFSAYVKSVELQLSEPVQATRRSLGLLALAKMPNNLERFLMTDPMHTLMQAPDDIIPDSGHVLDPQYLAHDEVGENIVFTDGYESDLDVLRGSYRGGCPAPEAMLRDFYGRFVDVVIEPWHEHQTRY